ncbi:hypothetical protein VDGE_03482 [Verticillium dahliae]|uniref:Zn(2)-C6 fungal-type domain-containing protein n=1 Tax=Verticillium dahliae TaxID=27337 RepID=A0A444RSR6_VERDA|nr:hypothetical protein VDGE_03482 [Verticillium dahliae]
MDAADVFRQGFNSFVPPRPRPVPYNVARVARNPSPQDDDDGANHPGRIAHTLTACCRCRQRKTRCDPTLPRCLPCERSGSVCEYYDATKGRKIGRNYVVKLQEKVRQLENELSMYTDEDNDHPRSNEDFVLPGGLVRLSESEETPRYLGPSSGIAMTRLLMEQAKLFTDSKRISELIPEVRARRQTRMQSIVMAKPTKRKKSYPTTSAHPATSLPARQVADRLVDIFCQRSQVFWPTLHEKQFLKDLEEVFAGGTCSYKNFIVRMVFAISLQKLDIQYAGLADSYYLAAMEYFEIVIRSKDLRTLQCLALIGQYSMLTPTRMAIYHVVGMATRICQAEGLTDEKTISADYSLGLINPLTLDMRRRLSYVTASMEFGLAHSMGRPNGISKGDDYLDVEPFATVDDEYITEKGILPAPPSEKKLVALHFFKMRMAQAEIKRFLYEKKRPEPKNETHPWFSKMEKDIQDWVDQSPENPAWCKPWFTGRAHQMRIFLHRPSPQIPKPSGRAALICYEGAAYIINLSKQQMEKAAVDITWIFLLTLFMALNTMLWAVSYSEVRQAHSREEVDELVQVALDIVDQEQCAQRWPGSESASNLYSVFAKACLQVYDIRDTSTVASSSHLNTPSSIFDTGSPQGSDNSASTAPSFKVNAPQFGTVFDATPEAMNHFGYEANYQPIHPTFRSNSIFMGPSTDQLGRRFSAYPPELPLDDQTPPGNTPVGYASSMSTPAQHSGHLPTPPESLGANQLNAGTPGSTTSTISPPSSATPTMPQSSPAMPFTPSMNAISTNMSPPPPPPKMTQPGQQPHPPQRGPTFVVPPPPPQVQQRPLPTPSGITDWFSPPPPFITPYNFTPMSNSFFNDGSHAHNYTNAPELGLGIGQFNFGPFGGPPAGWNAERQGSLSQEQQLELMTALETDGMGEIDAFLNMGMDAGNQGVNTNGWS